MLENFPLKEAATISEAERFKMYRCQNLIEIRSAVDGEQRTPGFSSHIELSMRFSRLTCGKEEKVNTTILSAAKITDHGIGWPISWPNAEPRRRRFPEGL